eukprot:4084999-Lingulodinium_polyedra.AAC.1
MASVQCCFGKREQAVHLRRQPHPRRGWVLDGDGHVVPSCQESQSVREHQQLVMQLHFLLITC